MAAVTPTEPSFYLLCIMALCILQKLVQSVLNSLKIEQKINGQKRSHRHSWSNLKVTEVIKRMLKDIIKSVVNILEKTSRADLTD